MDLEARDKLVEALSGDCINESHFIFKQLHRDLIGRTEPLKVSYADLEAFQSALNREREISIDACKADSVDEAAGLDEYQQNYSQYGRAISIAIEVALEAGVLTTQDTARSRIASRG